MLDYDYTDVPTVYAFNQDRSRNKIITGPFGSGKSSGCVQNVLESAEIQHPWPDGIIRARTAVVRNTYPQLRDTTLKTFFDWFRPQDGWGKYSGETHNYNMCFRLPKDHFAYPDALVELEVCFRALDRPDQVSNLLSAEYTNAWFNEVRETPLTVWDHMDGRIDRYPPRKKVMQGAVYPHLAGDTNPPDDDHWIPRIFEEQVQIDGTPFTEKERQKFKIYRQPGGDTPQAENTRYLAPGYYENLAMGKSDDFIRVYVKGLNGYVQEGKPVYPEYNDHIHCREFDVVDYVPMDRGWDFGLTPACVYLQKMPNGQLRIFDETIATRMGAKQIGKEVLSDTSEKWQKMSIAGDHGDPAGLTPGEGDMQSAYDHLNSLGIVLQPGKQSLEARLEAVRSRLTTMIDGEPGLLIHPGCRKLRKGFKGKYEFKRVAMKGERFRDKPDKNEYSHPHDALQYACTNLYSVWQDDQTYMQQQRHANVKYIGS